MAKETVELGMETGIVIRSESEIKKMETALQRNLIAIDKADKALKKSVFDTAKAFYEIKTNNLFEVVKDKTYDTFTDFMRGEFANSDNVSLSYATKLIKAYEIYLSNKDALQDFSLNNVYEMKPIEKMYGVEEIANFIESEEVLPTDTQKSIRDKVKKYCEADIDQNETEETEEAEETETCTTSYYVALSDEAGAEVKAEITIEQYNEILKTYIK